jgi:hypothetical protein
MPHFQLKESNRHLTSTAGVMLIGHCLALAQWERLDIRLPKRGKIRMSDGVKSYLGLLVLGKSDFEAIEAFRRDRFFQEALGIDQVLRQRVAVAAVGDALLSGAGAAADSRVGRLGPASVVAFRQRL